jgi:D-alanyl-D-alanine carboxypeptidase
MNITDLLYGMMLPSGNDAACQIAMIGGTILKLV